MNIKDVNVGMSVRVKTKLEYNTCRDGKHGVGFSSSMANCIGKVYIVTQVNGWGGARITTPFTPPHWLWDVDWFESVECAPPDTAINLHVIHYIE